MDFAKLHGLGNDFVLVDLRGAPPGTALPDAAFARRVCDRHRGVGADGILTLLDVDPPGADPREHARQDELDDRPREDARAPTARLIIHNPDGSRPEMCGNGARCAALWMASAGGTRPARGEALLVTDAGERRCVLSGGEPATATVEIAMGQARLDEPRAFPFAGGTRLATPVSVGNPHRVFFFAAAEVAGGADGLAALCAREGPALCAAEDANIELAIQLGPQRFAASVWERGAGATLACGTGACAVAAAAIARGLADKGSAIEVLLPGGLLSLRIDENGELRMNGPAALVFTGTL